MAEGETNDHSTTGHNSWLSKKYITALRKKQLQEPILSSSILYDIIMPLSDPFFIQNMNRNAFYKRETKMKKTTTKDRKKPRLKNISMQYQILQFVAYHKVQRNLLKQANTSAVLQRAMAGAKSLQQLSALTDTAVRRTANDNKNLAISRPVSPNF